MLNDIESIRNFLKEALLRADPTSDVEPGSALDTEVITPAADRLGPDPYNTPLRDFIKARISSEFPDLAMQDGDVLDDTVVKIMQILVEPYRRQIKLISKGQSVVNSGLLTDEEADNLGANFFIDRREGRFSSGVARLYCTAPRSMTVTPSNACSDSGGLKFIPVENQAISASTMQFNIEDGLYYFDVLVRSEKQGSAYNIDPGSLITIENIANIAKITNKSGFYSGADREDTETYLARVSASLTEKSLVTERGIIARFTEVFDNIRSIAVIGYGDPEMQRDVLRATQHTGFVSLTGTSAAGSYNLTLSQVFGVSASSFAEAGITPGDTLKFYRSSPTSAIEEYVVESLAGTVATLATAPVDDISPTTGVFVAERSGSGAVVSLSDIPGGILSPNPRGEIDVANNEVHVGGMVDVYVRAGTPQKRNITLTSIRDATPIRYGVDLETFGEESSIFVSMSDFISNGVKTSAGNLVLVYLNDANGLQWYPDESDVGRYMQLRGASDYGLFEILGVLYRTEDSGRQVVQVQLGDNNHEKGPSGYSVSLASGVTHSFRLIDKISTKNLVRDRDNSNTPAGVNFTALGASIGDSVIIENGDDAGIYSVRAIFDSIGEGDVAALSQDLTKTVTPTGSGGGSGLRYRLADELTVNLTDPRTTKVPAGVVYPGDDIATVSGSKDLSSATTDFVMAGVSPGDYLEILDGDAAGTYVIATVQSHQVSVASAAPATTTGHKFTVYTAFEPIETPMVRVSYVELLDSASQPTSVRIPYGDIVDFRVLGGLANRSAGENILSYSGEVTALDSFTDLDRDFVQEGVQAGDRLSVFSVAVGDYIIKEVVSAHVLTIDVSGGESFPGLGANVHYRIGQPSTGKARLYFTEPTSVNLATGIAGGRITYKSGSIEDKFMFSTVAGRYRVASSGDGSSSRCRVINSVDTGGGAYRSLLEMPTVDVVDAEISTGDVVELQQPILLRDASGKIFNFYGGSDAGASVRNMFAGIPGIMTAAGSSIVRLPGSSEVDFLQMDTAVGLVGEDLIIDSGTDAGVYTISEVVSARELKVSASLLASTDNMEASSATGSLDVTSAHPDAILTDLTVNPAGEVGQYITIFEVSESEHEEVASTWKIKAVDVPGNNVTLENVGAGVSTYSLATGTFKWSRSASESATVEFSLFNHVPTEFEVETVATTGVQKTPVSGAAEAGTIAIATTDQGNGAVTAIKRLYRNSGDFVADGVVAGDTVEITYGVNDSFTRPNGGVYFIHSVSPTYVDVVEENPFLAVVAGPSVVSFRVRGGIHGPRSVLAVVGHDNSGAMTHGINVPVKVREPGVFRASSTDIADNFDGALYYVDVDIESLGAGDNLNLEKDSRLTVDSGISVDGYVYEVENEVLTFSPYENVSIRFDRRFLPNGNSDSPENLTEISGRSMLVAYDMSPTTKIVDDMLHSDKDRPVNANPIARHFIPSYVLMTMSYQGGGADTVVGPEVEDYINGLGATDPLKVSDIEKIVSRRGATYTQHPVYLASVTHGLDRKIVVDRSEDQLGAGDVLYNGTARTSSFFADVNDGLNVVKKA